MTELANIPRAGNPADWTAQQLALMEFAGLVKVQGPNRVPAPRPVIEAFLAACHRTQLDPIARQIYALELGGKYTIMVSIDGLRLVAQRTGKYRGATPTEWTGDGDAWRGVWLDAKAPAAARVGVIHADYAAPLVAVATFAEFGKTSGTWRQMPAHMLAKVAESLALRRAFPMELSGLYTPEEMDNATPVEPTRPWLAELKKTTTRTDAAALFRELKDAGEWTDALHAEFASHGGALPADDAPAEYVQVATPAEIAAQTLEEFAAEIEANTAAALERP